MHSIGMAVTRPEGARYQSPGRGWASSASLAAALGWEGRIPPRIPHTRIPHTRIPRTTYRTAYAVRRWYPADRIPLWMR